MRWIQGFINPGTLYLPRPDEETKENVVIKAYFDDKGNI
jgi:hypothetical protein